MLNGFIDNARKPIYRLADEDGNILNIVSKVNSCLLGNNQIDAASEFIAKAVSCLSYEEILVLVMHYVIVKRICPICGKELGGILEYKTRNKRGWIYKCNKCKTWFLRDIGTGNMHSRYELKQKMESAEEQIATRHRQNSETERDIK